MAKRDFAFGKENFILIAVAVAWFHIDEWWRFRG